MTDDQEIARLRRQLAQVGITPLPHVDMPDLEQLETLRSMVLAKYRLQLSCPTDQFALALNFVAFARRQKKPNTLYYPVFWLDQCRIWLKKQGYDSYISLRAFVAACVASNVVYTPLDRWPFDVELGLSLGDASKPSNAWRDVLKSGIPQPTPLNRALVEIQPIEMIQRSDTAPRGHTRVRHE
jgi:hypothetical protein